MNTRTKIATRLITAVSLVTVFSLPAMPETLLTGGIAQERVSELTGQIHWLTDLQQAEAAAKQQGKLIFWVHMVGTIDGAT